MNRVDFLQENADEIFADFLPPEFTIALFVVQVQVFNAFMAGK